MTSEATALYVDCYAGARADEEPRRFLIGGRTVHVNRILDRWIDPVHRFFRVCGDDGGVCTVRQDTVMDRWSLVRDAG